MSIIDISLPLSDKTLIYPGNAPMEVSAWKTMPEHPTRLSKIVMGSHTGTHVDAPAHAVEGAAPLDAIPLETLVGLCRVLDLTGIVGESITANDLKIQGVERGERILAKTKNSARGFDKFFEDYMYLSGGGAEYLADIGIALFGIDYLSVKKRGSPDQRPHTALLSKNIPIIEGLDLSRAPAGKYTLVCLPLKFIGIEGAPARCILLR
ncbi:MAG: arylformamidase [Parcubacteria group bacterium Gr01-1014_72]|nr:MAG: arylformamidase [Parcubacteria group bacterium Gr01-1014_72]